MIVIEGSDAEGVRRGCFEQAMLETGMASAWWGMPVRRQFNFSGLGTTGGGVAGNSFSDGVTGIGRRCSI